jgi:hypothetical protein
MNLKEYLKDQNRWTDKIVEKIWWMPQSQAVAKLWIIESDDHSKIYS